MTSPSNDQWDPQSVGPTNRWVMKHLYLAPGGISRFCGLVLLGCAAILGVVTAVVLSDPDSLQSDRDFFPFITVFFVVVACPFLVTWLVAWVRARRRERR